jgi:hypothetical protein
MNKLSLLFNKPKGRFCEDAVCYRIELLTSFLRCDRGFEPSSMFQRVEVVRDGVTNGSCLRSATSGSTFGPVAI